MTHFLNPKGGRYVREAPIERPYAAVKVNYQGGNLVVCESTDEYMNISVLKADVLVALVPDSVLVLDPDGKAIRSSGRFVVTTETFDPFHLVADVPEAILRGIGLWRPAR